MADPYAALTDGAILAFYVGPSAVVGGTKTDMVVWANPDVFVQMWIGGEDKLPRRMRAIFAADPLALRHEMELSNWQLDPPLPPDTFVSTKAQSAGRMAFASPAATAARREADHDQRRSRPARPGQNEEARMKTLVKCGTAVLPSCCRRRLPTAGRAPIAPAAARATATARRAMRIALVAAHRTRRARARRTPTLTAAAPHAYGGGTEHTNVYGGSTYGRYGSGAYHTYPSGATAYHPPGYPAYPTYPVYHPPVAVPYYSSGCYGCAAAAGAVVGMAAGAAVASANTAAATSNAYNAGVAAGSANTAAATSAAYSAGVATGAAAGGATTAVAVPLRVRG